MKKDIFYFNRQDRIVTVILLALIVAVRLIKDCFPRPVGNNEMTVADSIEWNADTVRQPRHYTRRSYVLDTVYVSRKVYVDVPPAETDTVRRVRYGRKEIPTEKIDVNLADSAMLVSLPGVGEWTAKRILDYRERLGGFIDESQLSDIENLSDSLICWLCVTDSIPFRRIAVNSANLAELRKHPYMDFYKARAIIELRRERGKVKGPAQLSLLEEFTEQDLERLVPYMDFE